MKRLLSLFLVIVLLAGLAVPSFAAKTATVTPVIVVSGMGSFPLYDGEIKEENRVWGPQTKKILKAVGKSLLPLPR